jgi:hypothetical protein
LSLTAKEGDLLGERDRDALLPCLDRAAGQQEPGVRGCAHDPDPAAALGLVEVGQLAGLEALLVLIESGKNEFA